MARIKDKWWSKLLSLCFLTIFTMAIGVGFLGIQEAKTNTGVNLALDGKAIYPQSVDQEVPEIYGNNVVWMQQGNDYYYKIFVGNLENGSAKQIGLSPAAEKYPAIWENKVIWMDYRSIMDDPAVQDKYAYIFQYYDIYGYDLETDQEFPICTNPEWQGYGDIQKDYVVYADQRTGSPDILLYDLKTKEEYAICLNPAWQGNPVIYDNYIVWMDQRSGNYDIYGYDLTSGREFPICTAPDNQAYPAICGTKVAWQDKRNGNDDIYLYDLATNQEIPICTHEGKQQVPDIYGNIVVWQDDRNGNWDIYGYDLSTNQEFQITDQTGDQTFPAIFENRVIWVDSRSGHKNVYAATLPGDFAPQPVPRLKNADSGLQVVTAQTTSITSSISTIVPITGPSIIDYKHSDCKKKFNPDQRITEEETFTASYHEGLLTLFHTNAPYNCCLEEIAITMNVVNNVINIYEEEKLEGSGCRCICTYDLTTTIAGLSPGTYAVKFFNKKTGELLGEIPSVVIPSVAIPSVACPLPMATVASASPLCKPCPYATSTASGTNQWCCPMATTPVAGAALICKPCPYAEKVDNKIIMRCCPLAEASVSSDRLWCYPCPLAQNVDTTVQQWCCPVAQATIQGQPLWCRPCPIAQNLDNNVIRWCCPIAQTPVASNQLWCYPCPYVVEQADKALTLYCCPIV
jgi:beta propeller repeat protein